MSGFVYAIECASRIKIGFSEDPARRLNKIASDAPFPCELLGYWPGTVSDELAVHDKFRAIRLYGEWFAATVDLLDFISAASVQPERKAAGRHIAETPPVATDDLENWPAIIRRVLYLRQWNQSQLGLELGVHQGQLSRWLSEKHGPSRSARILLRNILAEAERNAAKRGAAA